VQKQHNFRRRRRPATQEHLIAPKKRVTQIGLSAGTS